MAKKKVKATGGALVYLVIDKSGSMEPIREATIDGVGRFVNETREANPDALFSLLLFDTGIHKPYTNQRVTDVEPLDRSSYRPAGGTALLDAMGHAMSDIEKMADRPEKVAIVVMTDGQENSSHEYTRAAVKAAVARHEKEDGWQVIFLGANLDSFAEAGAIGLRRAGSSADWQQTYGGTVAVASMASTATNSYLSGMTATADVSAGEYAVSLTAAESGDLDKQDIHTRLRAYKARRTTDTSTP